MKTAALIVCAAAALLCARPAAPARAGCPPASIFVYHRFGPTVADSMTIRTATFRSQLAYLREHHHPVVPLRALLACLSGGPPIPGGAVVITADDGHKSVYSDMLPLVREFDIPVTLFIYPSAISNASYAMTWNQLSSLRGTGHFDIQSHTYWHPNFKQERRRQSPEAFHKFVAMQFERPRRVLHDRLGVDPDELAWPFGIYDDELIGMARDAGYKAGFTLDRHVVTSRDQLLALPRFLVTDDATGARFAAILPKQLP